MKIFHKVSLTNSTPALCFYRHQRDAHFSQPRFCNHPKLQAETVPSRNPVKHCYICLRLINCSKKGIHQTNMIQSTAWASFHFCFGGLASFWILYWQEYWHSVAGLPNALTNLRPPTPSTTKIIYTGGLCRTYLCISISDAVVYQNHDKDRDRDSKISNDSSCLHNKHGRGKRSMEQASDAAGGLNPKKNLTWSLSLLFHHCKTF